MASRQPKLKYYYQQGECLKVQSSYNIRQHFNFTYRYIFSLTVSYDILVIVCMNLPCVRMYV